ncbi:MAG: hypothetical protein Q3979_04995 [Actinomycetaceae bacterium]|nr:hypothetical protein [Actinomycetaceae bacterium]
MSVKKFSTLIAVPFIALSLSACGSNSNSSDETSANETTTSQETSASEASTPAETSSDSSDSGDSAGKPSRDDVKSALTSLLEREGLTQQFSQLGATDEQINNFYGCVVDNVYDDMSAESLQALVNNDTSSAVVSSEEQSKLTSAAQTCGMQLGQEVAGNNAG